MRVTYHGTTYVVRNELQLAWLLDALDVLDQLAGSMLHSMRSRSA